MSKEEVEFYRSHRNSLRQIHCFLTASFCKKVALKFCESSNSQFKVLSELEIMCCTSSPLTLLENNEFNYEESKGLIPSGSILQVTNFREISENKFYINGRVFPSGRYFCIYFALNPDLDHLNLENEDLGKGDIEG